MTAAGSGYIRGEMLGITTSNLGSGSGAVVSVNDHGTFDVMYLTGVQGENFTNAASMVRYTDPNAESTRTAIDSSVDGTSTLVDGRFSGNILRIKQYNHAHHGGNNIIQIVDVEPDREKVDLNANFGINDSTVSVANTTPFARFEGITTTAGFAKIGDEIVSYSSMSNTSGNAGTLSITSRGLNGTTQSSHTIGESIQPYEVNGVSLTRINTTHNIPSTYYQDENSNFDNYFLEFDRTGRPSGQSMLNFESDKALGGSNVGISQNYQFSSIEPLFNTITPGKGTAIKSQIRTISGTSAGGNEISFIDQGFDSIPLNKVLHFQNTKNGCFRSK